ncbi:MAG: helix-turn-helix domain-containing protein [Nocardiopsaceae bacterium]|jgi:transcriptional regulator with XRE-family HTH domain|nr:helix-turn-helix domain-containing protein [Nocardiopsaceae bacterium]
MTSIEDILTERPVDPEVLEMHHRRMLAEVRAYRLREIREQYHLTQVQVAEQLDVSQKRVSRIESGDIERTQVDTLRRYVEAIGGTLKVEVQLGDETFKIG